MLREYDSDQPNAPTGDDAVQINSGAASPPATAVTDELAIAHPESAPQSELTSGGNSVTADASAASTAVPENAAADDSAPDLEHGFWPVLQNRNFLTLWSGQVFSQLADKVYLVLMITIIASQFEAPGQTISGWVSAVMVAFTIPAILFGSLAGVFIDRWSKKPVLVLTNILRGGLVLVLPIALWATQGWRGLAGLPVGFMLLLLITFLVSTLTQFFAPAEQAIMPLIVEKRHLLSANSLYTTTMMASVIIGFAVGEPMLAIADTLLAPIDNGTGVGKDVVVGLSYGLAGIILLAMRPRKEKDYDHANAPHVFEDIRDGLAYLGQQAQVRGAIIQLVLLFSVFAALAVLAVRMAELMPALKSSQFGFLLAAGGVGMAIGAALVGQFGQRFRRRSLSLYGSLGMATALLGIAWMSDRLWFSLALITILGFFAAVVGIPMQTTIQEKTPEAMRGKVFGLQNNLVNIALSLPLVLAGVAETIFGLPAVFIGLGAIVAIGGVVTWYRPNQFEHQE